MQNEQEDEDEDEEEGEGMGWGFHSFFIFIHPSREVCRVRGSQRRAPNHPRSRLCRLDSWLQYVGRYLLQPNRSSSSLSNAM